MFILVILCIIAAYIWVYSRIVEKAGYSGWWCLTMFIPVVNIVMVWVFAFADWPALNRQKEISEIFD